MCKPHKIQGNDLVRLNADLAERERLRRIMAENSLDVLEAELGCHVSSLWRFEKNGYDPDLIFILEPDELAEFKRRRQIYWLTREHYRDRYSGRALMARYGISKATLFRRKQELHTEKQSERKAA